MFSLRTHSDGGDNGTSSRSLSSTTATFLELSDVWKLTICLTFGTASSGPAVHDLLLDAWADAYRFDRHDVVLGHATGSGVDLVDT